MKKKLIIALCGLLSLTLFACKSGDDDNPSSKVQVKTSTTATKTDSEESGGTGSQETPAEPVKVTSVFIIVPDYLEVGDEDVIYVLTEPEGQPVKISCDTDVIELLDADCGQLDDKTWAFFIKAKKSGTYSVTAQSGEITAEDEGEVTIPLEKITIPVKNFDPLSRGQSVKLSATQEPAGADEEVTWLSSNPDIAEVDKNGKVTAKKAGKVTITASATVYDSDSFYDGTPTVLSDSVELTVKGFFLNETSFFLSEKTNAKNQVVEATVYGYNNEDIEWESTNTNIFTVTEDPDDQKKATISYVLGAQGRASLIVRCGSFPQAVADVYVAKYSIVALGDSISAGYAPVSYNSSDKDLEEPEMVATYKRYVERRSSPGLDPNYVNKYCYTNVMYEQLKENVNCTVNAYSKTGDRTDQLLEKLGENFSDATAGIKQGEILEAVKEADYITLCIGANDFLKNATASFLIGANDGKSTKSNEFFEKTYLPELERCLTGFKTNFDRIIEKITANDQHVFVMSIYTPYKYFELDNVPEGERDNWAYAGMGSIYTQGLLRLNKTTMEYIGKINDYMKEVAGKNDNVHFVDVKATFEDISKDDYPRYIHARPDRFSITTIRTAGFRGKIPIWFDPHPTIAGESKIADVFMPVFKSVTGF